MHKKSIKGKKKRLFFSDQKAILTCMYILKLKTFQL